MRGPSDPVSLHRSLALSVTAQVSLCTTVRTLTTARLELQWPGNGRGRDMGSGERALMFSETAMRWLNSGAGDRQTYAYTGSLVEGTGNPGSLGSEPGTAVAPSAAHLVPWS